MRIAILRDNLVQARRFAETLRADGHHCFIVEGRMEFVGLLSRCSMDLVIADRDDVFATARHLIGPLGGRRPLASVILVSDEGKRGRVPIEANAETVDVLQMPLEEPDLRKRIQAALLRAYPKQIKNQPFFVGPYAIHPGKGTILHHKRQLLLTHALFRLALCLMANVGRPLSRDYLREFIGAAPDQHHERSLDRQITALRHEMKFSEGERLAIRKISTFGYVLEFHEVQSGVAERRLQSQA